MKTFGTLHHVKGWWGLEAEPHVLLRAKRVFAGSSNQHRRHLTISDTQGNARDLHWFMQRYPLLMTDEAWAHLELQATQHEDRESLVDKLLRGKGKRRRFELAVPAREYQSVGAHLWLSVGGLLIADEVGTGKTATAICGLTDPKTRPALIVTLTALTRQW